MTAGTFQGQNVYNTPNSNLSKVNTRLVDIFIVSEWDLKEATAETPLANESSFSILSPEVTFSEFTSAELRVIEANRPDKGVVNTVINEKSIYIFAKSQDKEVRTAQEISQTGLE